MITTPGALVFKTNYFSFFSGTLAENNRLRLAHNVVVAFGKLMSAARGEVLCSITTAKVCENHYVYYAINILPYQIKRACKYDHLLIIPMCLMLLVQFLHDSIPETRPIRLQHFHYS